MSAGISPMPGFSPSAPDVPRAKSHRRRRGFAARYSAHDDKCAATGRRPTPTYALRISSRVSPTFQRPARSRPLTSSTAIKPDTVEGVFQRDAALNFMGFDHPSIPVSWSAALCRRRRRYVTTNPQSPEYRRWLSEGWPHSAASGACR